MIKEEQKKYYSFDLIGHNLDVQHGSHVIEVDFNVKPTEALNAVKIVHCQGSNRVINFRRIE